VLSVNRATASGGRTMYRHSFSSRSRLSAAAGERVPAAVPTSGHPCRPKRGRAMVPAAAEERAGVTGGGARGPRNVASTSWQHSIPPTADFHYSVTFRDLKPRESR
jgi:hypothetical protein